MYLRLKLKQYLKKYTEIVFNFIDVKLNQKHENLEKATE